MAFGIDVRHDQRNALTALGADGTKDIRGLGPQVLDSARTQPLGSPLRHSAVLLANAHLVL